MRRERAGYSVWQLGRVIPALLVAVLLMDVALRFVSIDPLTFRAWEALERNRPPGAAFEPNRRYYNARSYGDLAARGNFRELRQYRPDLFTTDALGYRNPPPVLNAEVSAILAGDSFTVGSGVSDNETLSSTLNRLGDCVVYNAGGDADRIVPDEILAVARRLHMRNRLVIRVYAERSWVPVPAVGRGMVARTLVARMPAEVRRLVGRLRGLVGVSPLQILTGRVMKVVADDRIFPNRYADNVIRATLYNGDTMLFLPDEVDNFYRRREIALDNWRWLRDELGKARVDLLVVLVPNKYTVYRSFLVDQRPGGQGADYLDRLERALRAGGIPVLNLTPVLSAEAARRVKHREYLYWLDDIHWNALGIALGAAVIREHWPLNEASCGTTLSRVDTSTTLPRSPGRRGLAVTVPPDQAP